MAIYRDGMSRCKSPAPGIVINDRRRRVGLSLLSDLYRILWRCIDLARLCVVNLSLWCGLWTSREPLRYILEVYGIEV